MSNNISLNEVKNSAFLANETYKKIGDKKAICQKMEQSQTLLQILVLKLSTKQNLLMVLALLYLEISLKGAEG